MRSPSFPQLKEINRENQPIIASVPYLNAEPLTRALPFPIIKTIPSLLIEEFYQKKVDAALLSLFDILQMPEALIVDQVAIGCYGPVHSVFLAHQQPLNSLEKILLDPASHTSNKLLQLLLLKNSSQKIDYKIAQDSNTLFETTADKNNLAQLLIGDPALKFRQKTMIPQPQFWDLGQAWLEKTGLPFIFALWCIHPQSRHRDQIANILRTAKKDGLPQRHTISQQWPGKVAPITYLTDNIHYELGDKQKEAIKLFDHQLREKRFLTATQSTRFIYC